MRRANQQLDTLSSHESGSLPVRRSRGVAERSVSLPAELQEVIAPKTRLLWVLVFAGGAFVITWLTGLAVVLSTQATLVNGAHVVAHPLALPLPAALTLLVLGGYGPALAALLVTATASGRTALASSYLSSFSARGSGEKQREMFRIRLKRFVVGSQRLFIVPQLF